MTNTSDGSTSSEIIKEIQEIIQNPADVVENFGKDAVHIVSDVAGELEQPSPNYIKIAIFLLLAVLATVGTPLSVWLAARR